MTAPHESLSSVSSSMQSRFPDLYCGTCPDEGGGAHIILRRTSSCGAHHPSGHIILWHTSSCSANRPAAHIIPRRLWRTSSCTHIILQRTSSCSKSSCGALHPEAHVVLRCTSSCSALHPAALIILRRTSSCGTHRAVHILLGPAQGLICAGSCRNRIRHLLVLACPCSGTYLADPQCGPGPPRPPPPDKRYTADGVRYIVQGGGWWRRRLMYASLF
ncbi:unnamed protein product [Pleuronectes platessa]|uniref:Uncharacterized protein n=1 Tax=Pleuronectes platessa TaxID=8262 RepID=A0A9N7YIZ3_PLEPL|nr:unnamed protein product [Pleuronectes platessa]